MLGIPASNTRDLTEKEIENIVSGAEEYDERAVVHMRSLATVKLPE